MKPFRFSIAEMMVVVMIVAMDLGTFRLLGPVYGPWLHQLLELIIAGALPLANMLAIGLLYAFHQRSRHNNIPPSLVRFEVWGWAALVAWIGCFALFTEPIHNVADRLAKSIISPNTSLSALAFLALLIGFLLLPPLSVALVGSRFSARYRIRLAFEPLDVPARDQDASTITTAQCRGDGSVRMAGH
ncbi:MAG: hypothetical protein ACLQIB_08985 [Isosphaeraceae bacterium]